MKAFALLAAAVLLSPSLLQAADTAYPLVTSIAISPASVDVTNAPGTITVTLHITDDESGFDFGNLNLFNQAGQRVKTVYFDDDQRLEGGTPLDGTYAVQVAIPRYAAPGNWRAEVLMLDNADNLGVFGPEAHHNPFPEPADSQFTVENEGEVDTDPPVISSVIASPAVINVDDGSADITLKISTSDALSGFSEGFIHLLGPNGADIFGYFASYDLDEGEVNDGVFKTRITVPQGSESGLWTVQVEVLDIAGNRSFSTDGTFSVGGPGPSSTFLAQAVDALQLPWTTSGSGWIYQTDESYDGIDAAVTRPTPTDGESVMQTTVTGPGTLYFEWCIDAGENDVLSVEVVDGNSEEISGSSGWTPTSVDIPAGEQIVIWRFAKNESEPVGADKGWVDRVHFEADTDSELPRLQGLHFSTRAPDISEDEAAIDFTIEISDDLNGFSEARIELYDAGGSPRISTSFDSGSRSDGDERFGTYHVSLPIGEDWPIGKSRVRLELTEASTGETRIYAPGEEAFPIPDMDAFHVIDGTGDDTEAPVLRALEITPRSVDVSNGPATVTVTLRATDIGRGLSDGNVTLLNPQDSYVTSYSFQPNWEDAYDFTYQVEVEIPQYAVDGRWSLSSYLKDHFSNDREYPWNEDFDPEMNPSITVVNSGLSDETAPEVTAFSLTPDQIDTTAAGVPVEITISIKEELAGVRDAYLFFYDPSGDYRYDLIVILNELTPISVDGNTKTYQVSRLIPQGSEEGTWRVDVHVRDHTGNFRNYGVNADPLPESPTFVVGDGETPSLFEAFLSTHSLTGNDALPGADPDGDGRNNVTELMLGTDPKNSADAGAGAFALSSNATHLNYDFTIDPTLTVTVAGLYLELRDGSGGAPLRMTGQKQTGLAGPWNEIVPVHQSGSTWRISLPFAGGSKSFARLFFEDP